MDASAYSECCKGELATAAASPSPVMTPSLTCHSAVDPSLHISRKAPSSLDVPWISGMS